MAELSILSVAPPIIVLIIGYLTKRIISSLIVGIFCASLIATNYKIIESIKVFSGYLWKNLEFATFFSPSQFWDTTNLFICIFLFILGIFVVMLQHSGGVFAYGSVVKKYIRSKKSAETSSVFLSTLLFLDDYFSSLTVGSVMYPLTDAQKIPRAKLAFLVDSMAAPLAILCPFSSWVAATLGFLRENGISEANSPETLIIASPISAYIHIIPFIFYSFILIFAVWFIVRKKISYGLMRQHELIAIKTGNLFGGAKPYKEKKKDTNHTNDNTSLLDFFMPVVTLLVSIFSGMLFSGNWQGFGGTRPMVQALQNSNAYIALFIGGIASLIICSIFFVARKRIKLKELPKIYWEGSVLMGPAIVVLMLAWTLGDILRHDLFTGQYLANVMLGSVSIELLPAILFVTATLIAFSIGSSWGTAAMMFPIAIPLIVSMLEFTTTPNLQDVPILFPILGAVLSGCVAGDHISPISDTTVMSATSSRTPHMDHVRTQMPYAIPIIIATTISFVFTGYLSQCGYLCSLIGVFIGCGLVAGSFLLLNKKNI